MFFTCHNAGPITLLIEAYSALLFVRLLLSWFPHPPPSLRPIFGLLYAITEPVLRLARPLIPPVRLGMAALDLSPLLVFLVLNMVTGATCGRL